MKLLFSEARADYDRYIFPYAVWAFPEPTETPADLFERGFLPSSRNLDRFYLCRQVRIDLKKFECSSENRRAMTTAARHPSRAVAIRPARESAAARARNRRALVWSSDLLAGFH